VRTSDLTAEWEGSEGKRIGVISQNWSVAQVLNRAESVSIPHNVTGLAAVLPPDDAKGDGCAAVQ